MIRSIFRVGARIETQPGLAELPPEGFLWVDCGAITPPERDALKAKFRVDPQAQQGSVYEDEEYVYLHARLVALNEARNEPEFHQVVFVLGDRLLATLHDQQEFGPLHRAMARLARRSTQANDAKSLLRMILAGINDSTSQVIEAIAQSLEQTADTIASLSTDANADGRELGVSDLTHTLLELNDGEELISRCLESQLALARVVRYLSGEIDARSDPDLQALVNELAADVGGVKEHAQFEHDKVRYLQNAVMGILNVKQNQIVKVFTIITAVFLPPTLVATFYGMNFANMPELSWQHGFPMSIALTLFAALLPLIYIKRKGWLR